MPKQILKPLQKILKSLLVVGLIFTLMLGHADSALAARAGGRIGGGSFRAPSRPYAPPSRTYRGPSRGGYPGGGFGFPFLFPIFGMGGGFGGLFTIFIFIAIANFLVRSFRNASEDGDYEAISNPTVSVARLQVGLLADARYLQDDLNRMAQNADTGSSAGLAQVLQESTLSLLRHPEYWAYAAAEAEQTRLVAAEQTFNRFALAERSKFSGETLSNVNSQLKQAADSAKLSGSSDVVADAPGEYIVATLVVGTQGKLDLPTIRDPQDLRQALSKLGSVSSEQLLAVEVLWTPQTSGETLTSDELVAQYPKLRLV
ncbi:MAG: DUF1517 domain-containing protein [Cyanobacteria bacterium P01_A01_bin.123]